MRRIKKLSGVPKLSPEEKKNCLKEIKSRPGVSLYPDSRSQRGVEAGGNNNNCGGGGDDLRIQTAAGSAERRASGGCARACAPQLLLRNKDRLMIR